MRSRHRKQHKPQCLNFNLVETVSDPFLLRMFIVSPSQTASITFFLVNVVMKFKKYIHFLKKVTLHVLKLYE
jgi:hypothetical protein